MGVQEKVLSIDSPGRALVRHDRRIGHLLVEQGKLGAGDVERVLEMQQQTGSRFGEAALRLGLIATEDLLHAIAQQYDFPCLVPGGEGISDELVVAREPFHTRAEEVRALRTQLLMRWDSGAVRHRLLAIVSPDPGEGRSYLAANLAVAFAQLGERTLLIDADLRRPRQHRIFGIPDRIGLSAVLSGRADSGAAVPVPGMGALSIMPAGAPPPNPQELLSHQSFAALLHELRTGFDIILFDTPPAKRYADAQGVAFRAGGALVLARKDHTQLADASGLIRELGSAGARIVGTVFNTF